MDMTDLDESKNMSVSCVQKSVVFVSFRTRGFLMKEKCVCVCRRTKSVCVEGQKVCVCVDKGQYVCQMSGEEPTKRARSCTRSAVSWSTHRLRVRIFCSNDDESMTTRQR